MKSKKLSIFLRVLGDSPKARVLEYLIETKGLDICLTDLAKNSRISRATLIRMWKDLIKERVIIPTRNVGRAKMFKLNEENQYIERMIEIFNLCMREEAKIGLKGIKDMEPIHA